MNIKKSIFAALLASVSLGAFAQGDEVKYEYVFQPHWYIQGQIGGQYTLGEIGFGKLLSPNAQVALGYNFHKVVGARLAVNAWQSRGGSEIDGQTFKWKYNYVAPAIDVTFNLSNLIAGVNPKRLVDVTAFVGGGVNIAWNNKEAYTASQNINNAIAAYWDGASYESGSAEEALMNHYLESQTLRLLWDKETDADGNEQWKDASTVRGFGRVGVDVDFKVAKRWTVGLELAANVTTDSYNSKKAGNADWYFNALAGVKYTFKDPYTTRELPPDVKIVYRDSIIEKEKIVTKVVKGDCENGPKRIDVFFTIASTNLVGSESHKVQEMADYLKKNENAKITITGYADKGTGNARINKSLSEKRAEIVKKELVDKYGISADRITVDFKGDTVQPYDVEVLNRVSILVAE